MKNFTIYLAGGMAKFGKERFNEGNKWRILCKQEFENCYSKYYVYVGMTGTYEIAEKIKSIYKDKGYVLYIKEKNISNRYFISDLEQYDKLLNSQDNYDNLNEVLKTIIDSYESNVKSL